MTADPSAATHKAAFTTRGSPEAESVATTFTQESTNLAMAPTVEKVAEEAAVSTCTPSEHAPVATTLTEDSTNLAKAPTIVMET